MDVLLIMGPSNFVADKFSQARDKLKRSFAEPRIALRQSRKGLDVDQFRKTTDTSQLRHGNLNFGTEKP